MAAAVAYRKKSYHSTVVPTMLAANTVRRALRSTSGGNDGGSATSATLGGTDFPDVCQERRSDRLCPPLGGLAQQAPLGQDRPHAFAEAVGLFEVRVAGQDEVVETQLRVFDDPLGNLLIRADQRGARATADQSDTGPQIRVDLQAADICAVGELPSATV